MLTNELEGVNKDVYKTDWQWQEGEYTVTRTNMWTAPGCHNGCSVLYYTKDGKVEKIEGDPLTPLQPGPSVHALPGRSWRRSIIPIA